MGIATRAITNAANFSKPFIEGTPLQKGDQCYNERAQVSCVMIAKLVAEV
jgi:hypothetical protein